MYCHHCGRKLDDSMCFCPNCGTKQANSAGAENFTSDKKDDFIPEVPKSSTPSVAKEAGFQQARFIISIVTMVFTFLILFQSCAAGLSNSLEGNLEIGGTAGIILCICWWVAGILNISKRKEFRSARNATIAYIIAGAIGLLLSGSFYDLKIYSILSFVFAFICHLAAKNDSNKSN